MDGKIMMLRGNVDWVDFVGVVVCFRIVVVMFVICFFYFLEVGFLFGGNLYW